MQRAGRDLPVVSARRRRVCASEILSQVDADVAIVVAGAPAERLRTAGKIAEAGVSNHTPAQVAALRARLPFELASIQPEFSPLAIESISDGVLDQALELGLGVMAWSPLGGGRLGGEAADPRAAAVVAVLDELTLRHGVSRSSIAYAWIMAHPSAPIPIVGSQRPDRIRQSAEALTVSLSRAEWYAVLTARATSAPPRS